LRKPFTAYREAGEAIRPDGNAVALHDHRPLGHRQIVGEDTHGILLHGVQFDDRATAEPQHLMDWHYVVPSTTVNVDGNLVECGHFFSLLRRRATMSRYKVTMVW
jgi:hypothetical protein